MPNLSTSTTISYAIFLVFVASISRFYLKIGRSRQTMKRHQFSAVPPSSSHRPTVITMIRRHDFEGGLASSSSSPSSPLISVSRSFLVCLISQLLFLSAHSGSSSSMGEDLSRMARGVPLMKRSLYDPNIQTFSCLDGSRVIPVRQVNDDYCDCKDGSDEPGTSACPQVRSDEPVTSACPQSNYILSKFKMTVAQGFMFWLQMGL